MINTDSTENIFRKVIHLRQETCSIRGRDHKYAEFSEQSLNFHRSVCTIQCPLSTRIE